MDVFRGPRSKLRLVTSDPRIMADEYEALRRVAPRSWRIEMRDMHQGREGSLITFTELRRRQQRPRHGTYLPGPERRAETADRKFAARIARWARGSTGSLPDVEGHHDSQRVRMHAYEATRDAGIFGPELDRALDRINRAVST